MKNQSGEFPMQMLCLVRRPTGTGCFLILFLYFFLLKFLYRLFSIYDRVSSVRLIFVRACVL
jgi:hypothetical protein